MLPKDNAFNVMKHFRLPVDKGDKRVFDFLSNYYKSYLFSLKEAVESDDKRFFNDAFYRSLAQSLPLIQDTCSDILHMLQLYNEANLSALYDHVTLAFNKIRDYIYTESWPRKLHYNLYRIRTSDNPASRTDLFHIPQSKRAYIRPYRYSISGYPCLYLATGIELCWFECGMPKKFNISQFLFEPKDAARELNFIDFSYNPIDLYSGIIPAYLRADNVPQINDFIIRYFVIHPLRVACSITVRNKNVSFIEEYIVPQLLLLWVRDSGTFDGIIYCTASSVEEARKWNSKNIVIPAKSIESEYCSQLSSIFKITNPIFCDVASIFSLYSEKIDIVKRYTDKVELIYFNEQPYFLYREIISLCKSFLFYYNCIVAENYLDPEPLYQMMDTLNLLAYIISDNKSHFLETAIQKAQQEYPSLSSDVVNREFDIIVDEFVSEIKPILFDFWGSASRVSTNINIDYSSGEYI